MAKVEEAAIRRAGASFVLALFPFLRPPRTPSRSVAQMSLARRTTALCGHSWRARDARVNAQRVSPERKHLRAISVSPDVPNCPVFSDKFRHTANRVDALRRRLRSDARARSSPRRGRLWHGAEGLPQHGLAPDEGQSAQRQSSERVSPLVEQIVLGDPGAGSVTRACRVALDRSVFPASAWR
jgi:hypothetical protein